MNWDDVGDAIHASIVRASGLAADHVVWKDQNRRAPTLDYVTIKLGSMLTVGVDRLHRDQDLTRPNGQEIRLEVRGLREVPIEIECFTSVSTSNRNGSALSLCSRIVAGLLLPSVRDILSNQGVTPFDPGPVNWIPDLPSVNFRGRAVCTVRCYMPPPTVAEYVGYISRITGRVYPTGWTAPSGSSGFAFDSALG